MSTYERLSNYAADTPPEWDLPEEDAALCPSCGWRMVEVLGNTCDVCDEIHRLPTEADDAGGDA